MRWCIAANGAAPAAPANLRPVRQGRVGLSCAQAVRRHVKGVESGVIFKAVLGERPYPSHGLTLRDWAEIPPRQVRLDQLTTTKRELALDKLLAEDSTFYGDLFPHVVEWNGSLYLEDGLHRALRAALQQRTQIHARVLVLHN
jgi:Arc/MetJ family transcription regulator